VRRQRLLAVGLGPPLLAALAPRGSRGGRTPIDPELVAPVATVVTAGHVADLGAQALLECVVLRRLRGEVTLDPRQASVRLVEALRRQEVGNLAAVRQLLRLAQVTPQLIQAIACVRCVDRERFARDHELATVHDVASLVAHEVALARNHGRPDERLDLLRADRAVHHGHRRCRVGAVELLHVRHRQGPAEELRALPDVLRPERELTARAVEAFRVEVLVVLDPQPGFRCVGRHLGLRALGRDRRDFVVGARALGDRLVDGGVRDASVRHRCDLFVAHLRNASLLRHEALSIALVGHAGSSGGHPHNVPR